MEMKQPDRWFIALAAGSIAFAVSFVAPMIGGYRVPWYYPLERRWAFEVAPKGLAMDFFGRTILATLAWLVVVAVTFAVTRRAKTVGPRTHGLLAAWAVTAIVLVMMHFVWTLYFRVPKAMPLPEWYVPR